MTTDAPASASDSAMKQNKDRIVNHLAEYINAASESEQPLTLARFLTEQRTFIVKNTTREECDKVEQIWKARFSNLTKKLESKVARGKKPDWGPITTDLMKQFPDHDFHDPSPNRSSEKQIATKSPSTPSASKVDSFPLSEKAMEEYKGRYEQLEESKKWKLSTGTCVEDVMYKFASKCTHEHAAHSFILCVDDKLWRKEFTAQELAEIAGYGNSGLPDLEQEINEFLAMFTMDPDASCEEALDQIIDRVLKTGPYDLRTKYDLYWLRSSVEQLCSYYQYDVLSRLDSNISEMDLVVRYWSILDRCFDNIHVTTGRDRTCIAISQRVNECRSVSGASTIQSKKSASRPDLLLLKTGFEFGCSEVGKDDDTTTTKKEIVETQLHSPKTMKDLFDCIVIDADRDLALARGLKIPCFHHTGLQMKLVLLDCPAGYVCRVMESERFEIPWDPRRMVAQVLPMLMLTLQAKAIVRKSVEMLEGYKKQPKGIPQLKALAKPSMPTLCLPRTLTTFLPTTTSKRKHDEMS